MAGGDPFGGGAARRPRSAVDRTAARSGRIRGVEAASRTRRRSDAGLAGRCGIDWMSGGALTCGPPDPCEGLLAEILAFMANLQKRYWDLRADIGNLPQTPPAEPHPRYGTRSIAGERHQFEGRQQGLRNRLTEYQSQGCGPPPPDAWEWATREVPAADPKSIPVTQVDTRRVAETAAATGAAVGIGYILYRIVRMIPSLAPPAWGTIPINLAVP